MNLIANIASILGFIISITTLCYAYSINKAVNKAQNKALFNLQVDDYIDRLKSYNRKFSLNSESLNSRFIKSSLNQLSSTLTLLEGIMPTEYESNCKAILNKCSKGYSSIFYESGSKCIFKKYIDKNAMWAIYDDINTLIDILENIKQTKKIIS